MKSKNSDSKARTAAVETNVARMSMASKEIAIFKDGMSLSGFPFRRWSRSVKGESGVDIMAVRLPDAYQPKKRKSKMLCLLECGHEKRCMQYHINQGWTYCSEGDCAKPAFEEPKTYYRRYFGTQKIEVCPELEAVDAIERAYLGTTVQKAIKGLRKGDAVPCAFAVYSWDKSQVERTIQPANRRVLEDDCLEMTFRTVVERSLNESITERKGKPFENRPGYWVCGPTDLANMSYELLAAGERHEIEGDYDKAKAYYDAACLTLGWPMLYELPNNSFYQPRWSAEYEEDRANEKRRRAA